MLLMIWSEVEQSGEKRNMGNRPPGNESLIYFIYHIAQTSSDFESSFVMSFDFPYSPIGRNVYDQGDLYPLKIYK